jgi:diaminohydroxyphosphoribosylaminopyrimidine deaminase/5-amino-6-(5-phosphoribosylamino)uracil reductase
MADSDEKYMWMALDLARQGRGSTNPNPMVGAVLVQDGAIVGTGYHQVAGGPHAEIIALRKAGERARGATLYVNLEPCSHHGRTAPCVDVVIKAGVSRVVAAMEDPNPKVAGRGFQRLRDAGIAVETGILAEKARRLNEVFVKYITTALPFVSLKTAMTMDGKIATRTGASHWITGEKSRQFVHRLRHNSDAVMVGIETVVHDDPRLTTRLEGGGGKDSLRVIVDSSARLPLEAKVINPGSRARTLLATTEAAAPEKLVALRAKGVEIAVLPSRGGKVDLRALIRKLGEMEITALLVEGGGTLNYSLLQAGLVDKLYLFIAPLIFGGRNSPTAFGGEGVAAVEQAWRVRELELKQFDGDLLMIGYPQTVTAR